MTSTTTFLSLPLLSPSQAQKTVTHNEALTKLDAMVQLSVLDRTRTAPPSSPAAGAAHLVAGSATGAWAGRDRQLAVWNGTAWQFTTPRTGWRAWVQAEETLAAFDGTAWVTEADVPHNFLQLGIGGAADATNKLMVRGPASLFQGDTAGHQVKINKIGSTATASLALQTGFATRAEIGLVGSNDLTLKVSPDGSSFIEGLVLDGATGQVTVKQGLNLAPAAGDPSSPADGDLWYNAGTGTFRGRQGGSIIDMAAAGSNTFSAATFTVQDAVDATKKMKFGLSGLSSGTTRTISVPNMSGTLAIFANFATRAAAVSWLAGENLPEGAVITVAGLAFRKSAGAGAIADMPNWLPAVEVFPDHFKENTVPGTTDMTAAILAAAQLASGGGIVRGTKAVYAISGQIDLSALSGLRFDSLSFAAIGSGWVSGDAMFRMSRGSYARVDIGFDNCTFEGAFKANGVSITNCARVKLERCNGHGFPLFAVKTATKAGELVIANCSFEQYSNGETGWNVAANRTATLIDIDTDDFKVSHTNASYCLYPIRLRAGAEFGLVDHSHFFNDGYVPTVGQPYAALIEGLNITLDHCDFDNGMVGIDAFILSNPAAPWGSLKLTGNFFRLNGAGVNTNAINFTNAGAAVDLNGVVLQDNTAHGYASANDILLFTGSYAPVLRWAGSNNVLENGTAWGKISSLSLALGAMSLQPDQLFIEKSGDPTSRFRFTTSSIPTGVDTSFGLPNAAGTLVGTNSSHTITGQWTVTSNLTVNDQNFILRDGTDTTKKASFELTGLTTATTRTYSLPDANGTLALNSAFTSAAAGLAPASGGGTTNFLRADGTWAAPAGGGGVTDGDKGDVVVSASGSVWSLDYTAVNAAVAPVWANVTSRPTTVSGYGITDAVTTSGTQSIAGDKTFSGNVAFSGSSTVIDSGLTLQDNVDATKKAQFELSSITTGTTRTFTLPDTTGTLLVSTQANPSLANVAGSVTVNVAAGATTSGNTKAVNIGTAGLSGSTTSVVIGSGVAGANGSLVINSPTVGFGSTVTSVAVPDAAFTLQDNADATKQAKFELGGLTAATTRTFSLPDATGTLALNTAFTSAAAGLAPASGGGTANFLRADGTWAAPAGGGSAPGGSSSQIQFNNAGVFAGASKAGVNANGSLELAVDAAPLTPAANTLGVFGRKVAERMMLAQIGPSGLDTSLQPLLARNKIGYWNPPGNATTVPGVFGITAPTVVGTATGRNVATTNGATRMRRLGYVSAATAGSLAEARIAVAQFSCGSGANDGSGFFYVTRFVPSNAAAVAGERFFIGLRNNTSAATNVEPDTLGNSIGIAQLSTDATQFYLVYGGTIAQTAIALGTSLGAPGTLSTAAYELAIFAPNSVANTYHVQVTNIFTGVTVTQTISGGAGICPQSSTLLAHRAWKCNNATALAVGFDICSIYIETDV